MLEELSFGTHFNQALGQLPSNLKRLVLGRDFNQPLPPELPAGLKSLSLGHVFNQSLHQARVFEPAS